MSSRAALDHDRCHRAIRARDRRFDGVFFTGVHSTGIYCRPSCPARTPGIDGVDFHPTAAAAQEAGFRACKRCRPDLTPGSPDWNVAADVAGRAMRLIADGVVDREGVGGLADRLGFSERHLGRLLRAELGAGPLSLARAQRAQVARTLVESTDLALAEVAFAAGFTSVRQFNDTIREVYAATPGELRTAARRASDRGARQPAASPPSDTGTAWGEVRVRLAVRTPFAARELLDFLAFHLVPGVEIAGPGWYARTLDLPRGPGTVHLTLDPVEGAWTPGGTAQVHARFRLADLRDTVAAVERTRRLLDADCDPLAVDEALAEDPLLRPLVAAVPGLRLPGQVDGAETAIRTVIGQQVSVTGARTVTGRIVAAHGRPVATGVTGLTHLFPDAATLAGVDPTGLPMPRARGRALVALAAAIAEGAVALDRSADREQVRAAMLALPGIGPWTADYVAMRVLAHPDAFLPTDLGVKRALRDLGVPTDDLPALLADTDRWRPWRSYALMHLWRTVIPPAEPATPEAR